LPGCARKIVAMHGVMAMAIGAALAWLVMAAPQARAADAPPADLRAQLEALADAHRIRLDGAQRVLDGPPRSAAGSLEAQLAVLLDGHNYVIQRDASGAITAVIVSGERSAAPPPARRVSVKTVRLGSNHFVEAVVMGERPVRTRLRLMLDTGASQVVLPKSMIEELGYGRPGNHDLLEAVLQTANGPVSGYLAKLRAVEVGPALETDVDVAFIDDDLLGGNKLLGMSFLGRFVVTLDDASGTLGLDVPDR